MSSATSSKDKKSKSKLPEGPWRYREGVNEWKVQGTRFHIDERYRVIKAVSAVPMFSMRQGVSDGLDHPLLPKEPAQSTPWYRHCVHLIVCRSVTELTAW
jgi:hypothetical protein